jgi:hypothetical protein
LSVRSAIEAVKLISSFAEAHALHPVPADTLEDFVAYAKRNPGKYGERHQTLDRRSQSRKHSKQVTRWVMNCASVSSSLFCKQAHQGLT